MKKPGQIVLFQFPQTNTTVGKLRPALLISQLPGSHDDWLICMISTQLHQYIKKLDEIVAINDIDFASSGLKTASLIRAERLAVVEGKILLGAIGEISHERLTRIKTNLANWIKK